MSGAARAEQASPPLSRPPVGLLGIERADHHGVGTAGCLQHGFHLSGTPSRPPVLMHMNRGQHMTWPSASIVAMSPVTTTPPVHLPNVRSSSDLVK